MTVIVMVRCVVLLMLVTYRDLLDLRRRIGRVFSDGCLFPIPSSIRIPSFVVVGGSLPTVRSVGDG